MITLVVDVIVEVNNKVLLIKRAKQPFKGMLALPGGHVEQDETVAQAALRELKEETGIKAKLLNILGVYSALNRDPRGRYVSVVFIARPLTKISKAKAATDASKLVWLPLKEIKKHKFAFDHKHILRDYLKWKKTNKTFWS